MDLVVIDWPFVQTHTLAPYIPPESDESIYQFLDKVF